MNKRSVAIVGGGIAGLVIADRLLDQGCDVVVFEKNNRLGGRIKSIELNKFGTIEAGAGRFNEKHKLLLKLIHQCCLHRNIFPITNTKRWYHTANHRVSPVYYDKYITKHLFGNISQMTAKYTKAQLVSHTMKEILLLEYPQNIVEDIISAFGYNSEFEIQNAYSTLNILQKEFNDQIQYYYLKGGLSQIINCLAQRITDKGGIILTGTTVIDYEPTTNTLVVGNKPKYQHKFDKVVFACTKNTLSSFKSLINHDKELRDYMSSIQMAPLNRIFALFPLDHDGMAWFKDLPRTTTCLPVRYIIPLNPTSGLIQISYTDNEYAKYWHNKSHQERVLEVMKQVRTIFPTKTIPDPVWIKSFYWNEGATYWKPSYKKYRNDIKRNYYIAGEIMSSTHSGWIEGALESAHNVLRLFTTR